MAREYKVKNRDILFIPEQDLPQLYRALILQNPVSTCIADGRTIQFQADYHFQPVEHPGNMMVEQI